MQSELLDYLSDHFVFSVMVCNILDAAGLGDQRWRLSTTGPENIFLVMLRFKDNLGLRILLHLGLDTAALESQVLRALGAGHKGTPDNAQGGAVMTLLNEAEHLRSQRGSDVIESDLLLCGILLEGRSIAAQVLADHGVTLEKVQLATLTLFRKQPTT